MVVRFLLFPRMYAPVPLERDYSGSSGPHQLHDEIDQLMFLLYWTSNIPRREEFFLWHTPHIVYL